MDKALGCLWSMVNPLHHLPSDAVTRGSLWFGLLRKYRLVSGPECMAFLLPESIFSHTSTCRPPLFQVLFKRHLLNKAFPECPVGNYISPTSVPSILWASPVAQPVKNLQCRRPGFNPWVRKIPWKREGQPTLVFLPGESHEQRSLGDWAAVHGVAKK